MSIGEILTIQTKDVPEKDLQAFGYTHSFVKANLRYLRDTYQQWYVERSQESVESAYHKICDALSKTPARSSGAPA
jgi:hypothetical protein